MLVLKHKNIKNMIMGLKGLNIKLIIVGVEYEIKNLLKINKINYKNLVDISDKQMTKTFVNNDIHLCSNYEGFGMPIIEAKLLGWLL